MGSVSSTSLPPPQHNEIFYSCLGPLSGCCLCYGKERWKRRKRWQGREGRKRRKGGGKGLCLTEEQLTKIFLMKAGTSLGERTMTAIETCSSNAVAETRAKKGKGKGKGKGKPSKPECPSVKDLEEMAMEKYAGEICVFQELGWMDSDMNEMEEVILADIETLPDEIEEPLKGDEYEECLLFAEEKMKSMDKKYKKCVKKYNEEEKDRLAELFTGIAETECFMYVFKKSAGSYVKDNLSSILGGEMTMTAAGRK